MAESAINLQYLYLNGCVKVTNKGISKVFYQYFYLIKNLNIYL